MADTDVVVTPVSGKKDLDAFIKLVWRIYADDPNWVPPLKSEMVELLTPGKNPFHEHADMQLFLARRGSEVVGRISAHIDHLAVAQPVEQGMGPGTGNWGYMEALDEAACHALIAAAEGWLKQHGMNRVLAPISQSIWEEPGLLVQGFDHPPAIMMGHHRPEYKGWIESYGYTKAMSLKTYDLDVTGGFPPLVNKIVEMGERNPRINVRQLDLANFERDVQIVIHILNDAWSKNWGFVPFTDTEIRYAAKKLKPLIRPDVNLIAELDGKAVAFMLTLPDANEVIKSIKGKLFPFGWIKLLRWIRNPKPCTMRVPLMGVLKEYQSSRMASQLAFMMIEYIRRTAVATYGTQRSEIGWILDDNQGMNAIADAIGSKVNKDYWIFEKPLAG
ncbi:N-acetyltransferase [Altererythrobacter sp. CC-YST694]|uniref:N-acetyltransferase n=1 Tax=Altererythrobacter sp. CC-YST694 TaxID=2755038 RepID=UPI001D004CCF|nr:N-acetyltransferase [Altererythrobacter sp. CC-YST694]MCB5425843.1 N-acetyltransferase [Altererythrobacter sp. CC-YST694]